MTDYEGGVGRMRWERTLAGWALHRPEDDCVVGIAWRTIDGWVASKANSFVISFGWIDSHHKTMFGAMSALLRALGGDT